MYNILSIDAWGNAYDGYNWNDCYKIGKLETIPDSDNELFDLMLDKGIIMFEEAFFIEKDELYILFCLRENLKPVYAIEY